MITDKERLEEIEQYAGYSEFDLTGEKAIPKSVVLKVEHYEWLVNRVKELERVNKQLKNNLSVYKSYYKNMIKINEDIVEENKCYREALEFYANEDNFTQSESEYFEGYPPEVMNDRGYKARKALECESE